MKRAITRISRITALIMTVFLFIKVNTATFGQNTATCPPEQQVCLSTPPFELSGALPAGGTYSGAGVVNNWFYPQVAGPGFWPVSYTLLVPPSQFLNCYFFVIVNESSIPVTCGPAQSCLVNSPPVPLTNASPGGGTYSGAGVVNNVFYPAIAGVGTHTITYNIGSSPDCQGSCAFTYTVLPAVLSGTYSISAGPWYDPLPGHNWIPASGDMTRVTLHGNYGLDPIMFVNYYYSYDSLAWLWFYTDCSGFGFGAYGPPWPVTHCNADEWTAWLDPDVLTLSGVTPVYFKVQVALAGGNAYDIVKEIPVYFDPSPLSGATVNIADGFVSTEDEFELDVDPGIANLSKVYCNLVEKADSFSKGLTGIQQNTPNDCGPAAAASCLRWLEAAGDNLVCGGLDNQSLVDSLRILCGTDPAHGTLGTSLERGLDEWVSAHGNVYEVRRIDYSMINATGNNVRTWNEQCWKQMRSELEAGACLLTLFLWPGQGGDTLGHYMAFNGLVNTPLANGLVQVTFMDPSSGTILEGFLNPLTGNVSGFVNTPGVSYPPDGAWVQSNIIISKQTGYLSYPYQMNGSDPLPVTVSFPAPGAYWLRMVITDLDGFTEERDMMVSYIPIPFTQEYHLAAFPWLKAQPWDDWLDKTANRIPVVLFGDDTAKILNSVDFYYSIDEQNWTLFFSDQNGLEYPSPGPAAYDPSLASDGFSGYLSPSALPPAGGLQSVSFKALLHFSDGSLAWVMGDSTYTADPTPPSSVTVNLPHMYVTADGSFTLDVNPVMANIDYITVEVAAKDSVFNKGLPSVNADPNMCGPASVTSCLKWFESRGDNSICGSLNTAQLLDSLAKYFKTGSHGTWDDELADGLNTWITGHGNGYTLRHLRYHGQTSSGEPVNNWNAASWLELRNELERGQDVILNVSWLNSDNEIVGHYLTLNSVRNQRLTNDSIRIGVMDPYYGEIVYGELDDTTGVISRWKDVAGNPRTYEGDSGWIESAIVICPNRPEKTNPAAYTLPGPDPSPFYYVLPSPGLYWLRVQVADLDGFVKDFDLAVAYPAQAGPAYDYASAALFFKDLDPEPWRNWVNGYQAASHVHLSVDPGLDPNQWGETAIFYRSTDSLTWTMFDTDVDCYKNPAPGPRPDSTNHSSDGWSGYFYPFNPGGAATQQLFLKAVVSLQGSFQPPVYMKKYTDYDKTPPSSFSLNIGDNHVTTGQSLSVDLNPVAANIDYITWELESLPDTVVRGLVPLKQDTFYNSGPVAAVSSLRWIAETTDPLVTGGLSNESLTDSLGVYFNTKETFGTYDDNFAKGLSAWLNKVSGHYTVGMKSFIGRKPDGRDDYRWVVNDWRLMRNEFFGGSHLFLLFNWADATGDTLGHFLCLDAIEHRRLDNDMFRLRFMDPATGTIIEGFFNDSTGHLTGLLDELGNPLAYPQDNAWLASITTLRKKETSPVGPEQALIQGPNPQAFAVNLPNLGNYLLTLKIMDKDGHLADESVIISRQPWLACPSDTSVHLLSSPWQLQVAANPGGTFSGKGVINNWFVPCLAGTGWHTIIYTLPTGDPADACSFNITVTASDLTEGCFRLQAGDYLNPLPSHNYFDSDSVLTVRLLALPAVAATFDVFTQYLMFAYSTDSINWEFFGNDSSGFECWVPGPPPEGSNPCNDGWSASFKPGSLPGNQWWFKVFAMGIDGINREVAGSCVVYSDAAPPSAVSAGLPEYQVMVDKALTIDVNPNGADLHHTRITVSCKDPLYFQKKPVISHPEPGYEAVAIAAGVFRYLENEGDTAICGPLTDEMLVDSLAAYTGIDTLSGTDIYNLAGGMEKWVTAHGNAYEIRTLPILTCNTALTGLSSVIHDNLYTARNEFEKGNPMILQACMAYNGNTIQGLALSCIRNQNIPHGLDRYHLEAISQVHGILGFDADFGSGILSHFTDTLGNPVQGLPDSMEVTAALILSSPGNDFAGGTCNLLDTVINSQDPDPLVIALPDTGLYRVSISAASNAGFEYHFSTVVNRRQGFLQKLSHLAPDNTMATAIDSSASWLDFGTDGKTLVGALTSYYPRFFDIFSSGIINYDSVIIGLSLDGQSWMEQDARYDGFELSAPGGGETGCADMIYMVLDTAMFSGLTETTPVMLRAVGFYADGTSDTLLAAEPVIFDPTPPDAVTISIPDGFVTAADTLNVDCDPAGANIASFKVEYRAYCSQYTVPVPLISAGPDAFMDAPAAAAAMLRYFESKGDGQLCAGLDNQSLADSLALYFETNNGPGTKFSDIAEGLKNWAVYGTMDYSVYFENFFRKDSSGVCIYSWPGSNMAFDRAYKMFLRGGGLMLLLGNEGISGTNHAAVTVSTAWLPPDEPIGNAYLTLGFMDPLSGSLIKADIDFTTGTLSNFTDYDGNPVNIFPDGTMIEGLICMEASSTTPPDNVTFASVIDPEPVAIPLTAYGTYLLHMIITDEDGYVANIDRIVVKVPQLQCPSHDTVCLSLEPFPLSGGLPAGGTYEGPGVENNIFSPLMAGYGTHSLTYTIGDTSCQSYQCEFQMTVKDCNVPVLLSGNVTYDNDVSTPLGNVKVYLHQGAEIKDSTITDAGGYYQFEDVYPGDYFLTAASSAPWGGCNANDALIIMRYFVGLEELTGLRLIVADVNNTGFINTSDALDVMKRFVSMITSFKAGDWKFESPSIQAPSAVNVTVNFKGLCVGDVNGSFIP